MSALPTNTKPNPPSYLSAALSSGIPGMAAMAIQVSTLMWLRTTMNYQYKYGTTTTEAVRILYRQGGIPRFYSGYYWALVQGPLSRFGDTAANAGALALLDGSPVPIAAKTLVASMGAASFRIGLMPVDTIKTLLQVEGSKKGWQLVRAKVAGGGPQVLFHGALAASAATFSGHYPWYTTYNYLNHLLPDYNDRLVMKLIRNAGIGFTASLISDTVSNSLRVVKTAKQTSNTASTYTQVARDIIDREGFQGLLGRGLKTRLLTNCIQGIMFSVLWKMGQDYYAETHKHK